MSNQVYQIITDRIISMLEAGTIPWRRPWKLYNNGGPRNGYSKREYRGINIMLLAGLPYESPDFFSLKQINDLGGHVKKGETGNIVTFWKMLRVADQDEPGELKNIPLLRYYYVFNREQCEGLPEAAAITAPDNQIDPIEAAEALIMNYEGRPAIREGEARAYYSQSSDFVNMPKRGSFASAETWYSVLFHELTHSTGHISRLGRLEKCKYYLDDDRSREELCAEMGAAFLCGMCDIEQTTLDNSAAYIESWLQVFKGDPRFVVDAAGQAQKAVDWMMGIRSQDDEAQDGNDATAAKPQPIRKPRKARRNSSRKPAPAPIIEAQQMTFSF